MGVIKRAKIDYPYKDEALTLNICEVAVITDAMRQGLELSGKECTRTHVDGWTITGIIFNDWYSWVNNFSATHPEYGAVHGNFETEVHADSEAGFQHFYTHHTPTSWDYSEI